MRLRDFSALSNDDPANHWQVRAGPGLLVRTMREKVTGVRFVDHSSEYIPG